MRWSLSIAAVLVFGYQSASHGQQPAADLKTDAPPLWTKEKIESPPKREIKFERLTEAKQQRLSRPDPKLLELKSSAALTLAVPLDSRTSNRLMPANLAQPPLNRWSSLFSFSRLTTTPQPLGGREVSQLQDSFRAAIEAIPADERPEKEVLDYFTSEQISSQFVAGSPTANRSGRGDGQDAFGGEMHVPLELLASSPEQAEQVAAGLLKILDWGVCRMAQLDLATQRDEREKARVEAKRVVDESMQAPKLDLGDSGRRGSLLGGETSASLSALRVQLVVERTGIKARLETCEKLMARDGLAAARREMLEDERLKAEIDLASVEVRLTAIAATFRLALESGKLRSYEMQVSEAQERLTQFAPPTLVDGVVVIRPLQWQ